MRQRIDQALYAALTRKWEKKAVDGYSKTLQMRVSATPPHINELFHRIDAKATALLTYCAMMIAGLGICAPIVAQHPIEEAVVIVQISIFLLISIGCLRCLSVFGTLEQFFRFRGGAEERRSRADHPAGIVPPLSSRLDRLHLRRRREPARDVGVEAGGITDRQPVRAPSTRDEIHPLLAQDASRHERFAGSGRREAHHDRARGREDRGPREAARAVHGRPRALGRKASQRRQAQGLHGRDRRRRAGAGRVRRAERARGHDGGVRAAGRAHPGQRHGAEDRRGARGREPRHAGFGPRDGNFRGSSRHYRAAGRRAAGQAVRRAHGPRRSGARCGDPNQPARLPWRRRHRAGSGRRGSRHLQEQGAGSGGRKIPLPGAGEARFRRDAFALSRFRAAAHSRREEPALARLGAAQAARHRAAADQRARRCDEPAHLRPRAAAARVRRREGQGPSHGAARQEGREAHRTRRAQPTSSTRRFA